MRCFRLKILLSVNLSVFCLSLLIIRILLATISGVSLLYDGFTVRDAALTHENNRVIKVTIFIFDQVGWIMIYTGGSSSFYKG